MKLNVMKAKPQITDDEIRSYMDFEGLIQKHKSPAGFFTKGRIISLVALTTIVATVVYYFMNNYGTANGSLNQSQDQIQKVSDNSHEFLNPIDKDSMGNVKAKEKIEQPGTKQSNTITPAVDQKINTQTTTAEPAKDVFVEAEPIEGFTKLYNFFNQNLTYPESNLKDKIEGVEIISFVIDEKGNVSDQKIVQSLGKSFDDEALRLIKAMPKWKPATLNGKPVPGKLSLPFTFSITK